MIDIYLRELTEKDAQTSYLWRNDPSVWEYTGRKPDRVITVEIELDWIRNVLKRNNEKRFAICISETNQYIGNVQLTAINGYDAEFHIFIGEKFFWGKGIAQKVTAELTKYAFNELRLQSVYLDVRTSHVAAIKAYEKAGYSEIFRHEDFIRMAVFESDVIEKKVSVFMMTYNHEKYVEEALKGILAQKVDFAFEIVVGDDFSSDTTRDILLSFAKKHPGKLKLLFYPRNFGAVNNQFWVLRNCTGCYIAFCEGDDYWTDPHKIQKQVDLIEKNNNCSIVWTNFEKQQGGFISSQKFDVEYNNGLFCISLENLFKNYVTWTLTCLIRRETIDIDTLNRMKYARDNTIYVMALINGAYGLLMEDVTAVYRVHEGGVHSMQRRFIQNVDGYKNLLEIEQYYPELKKGKVLQKVKEGAFVNSLIYFFKEKYFMRLQNVRARIFLKEIFSSKGFFYILRYTAGILRRKVLGK